MSEFALAFGKPTPEMIDLAGMEVVQADPNDPRVNGILMYLEQLRGKEWFKQYERAMLTERASFEMLDVVMARLLAIYGRNKADLKVVLVNWSDATARYSHYTRVGELWAQAYAPVTYIGNDAARYIPA